MARNVAVLPVPALPEEVHGICRTARSFGEEADVHVSHGDLAALPAIAAGATTLGTGWDLGQRVCGYSSYEARTTGDGGQWFQQATLEGLLSLMTRGEATLLRRKTRPWRTVCFQVPFPPDRRRHSFTMATCFRESLRTCAFVTLAMPT